eukprot:GHUV01036232.1.p3 GENE.GHUV01036232.1~~GHUV01036232.1.p3  ORF type:complete len:105 (-),score=26.29 GHUV01036232.1:406-720(-)
MVSEGLHTKYVVDKEYVGPVERKTMRWQQQGTSASWSTACDRDSPSAEIPPAGGLGASIGVRVLVQAGQLAKSHPGCCVYKEAGIMTLQMIGCPRLPVVLKQHD